MKISIGISVYNAEKYLAIAINSVISQSFTDWELILVNDGSTDGSLEIAKHFEKIDKRIRVISDGLNKKLPYRLNQIIDESNCDYIARMDADDIMHPDRLKTQFEFLEKNPEFDLVSTGLVSINNNNIVYGYRNVNSIYTGFNEIKRSYPIIHASILAKTSWYKRNKYNTSYSRSQDYELWCRAISKKDLKLAVLPDLLYYYREEGNLFTDKIIKAYSGGFKIYSKYTSRIEFIEYLKMLFKCSAIIILDKFNMLQRVASNRNNKNISAEVLKAHQLLVDKIVHSTITL